MDTAAATEIVKFEAGVSYYCRSLCDHECVWHFRILRRSASSVWIEIDGKTKRRGVEVWNGAEMFSPFGRYSMSPSVSAERRSITLAGAAG